MELKLYLVVITAPIKALKTEFSTEVYPALLGVGYICGAKISSYMFAYHKSYKISSAYYFYFFRCDERNKGWKRTNEGTNVQIQDIDMRLVMVAELVLIVIAIWVLPQIPVSLLGAILIVIFGFFFGAVSSRMVGLVGSSNNPVSGMAIATLLFYNTLSEGYRRCWSTWYGWRYINRFYYMYSSCYGR